MSTADTSSLSFPARLLLGVRAVLAIRLVPIALLGWGTINILAAVLYGRDAGIDRPLFEGQPVMEQLTVANLAMIEVLVLVMLVTWLTRNRPASARLVPARPSGETSYEIFVLVIYGVLALFGGIALGQAMGASPIGFHLAGTLFGAHDHDLVTPRVALAWAAYNLIAYAMIPFLWFRRRSGARAMPLRSLCRKGDLVVILGVLGIDAAMQLSAVSSHVLRLEPRQALIGVPATFALYFAGTVLPTVFFVQALLVPRFLDMTGSVMATVLLGGVAYTAVHASDSWMVTTSPGNAMMSLAFLALTYFGPGMIKTVMTVRTGNAWVHAWGYHALAPHTLLDTPLIVRIFGI